MSDFSIDGLIRYFQMAVKVMGFTNPEENSYEFHAAKMLKQLRDERDLARRMYCLAYCGDHREDAEARADALGWDCFKENTND